MNTQLKLILSATVVAATLGSAAAFAGASANVGVASNYIWRGVTQTSDEAAVSGGLDYDFGNGFSVGTWASNLADGAYELDLYGAYGGKLGNTDYSVGFINYRYPLAPGAGADFTEITGGLGFGPVSFDAAYTVAADNDASEGDLYLALSGSTDIKEGVSLGGTIGNYDFDAGGDYTHYQINLSKGDFTFAIDDNDQDGVAGDPRVSVAWSHALDL